VVHIDFKVIFVAKNSTKILKTRFWREKSVENVVTFECIMFNSSKCFPFIFDSLKMGYKYTSQNNVICCVHPPYIITSSHLGQWHRPH